ncbi:MAG: VWA domain-containing protein [Blastocatellia bacterium]
MREVRTGRRPRRDKQRRQAGWLCLHVVGLIAFTILLVEGREPWSGLAAAVADPGQSQQDPKPKPETPPPPPVDLGQDPTIRLGTRLVNVLFSAQDAQNRYINDLQSSQLEVYEDGVRQEIFTFKREFDLPLTMALLVDVSGSERNTLPLLKDAGGQFVDSVLRRGQDTAAVIKFEGEATVMQGLTSNPARVRRAIEELAFTAPPPTGIFGGPTPPINGRSRQGGTSLWDSIVATSSDLLAPEPGRKTIILLTDGQDTTSRMKIADAINEALRAEVVIYSIGIGDPGFGVDEKALRRISDATGGRAVFPKRARELSRAFLQLEEDLRQQYLLAYEPSNEAANGAFRRIEVRVPAQKEIRLRHRRGYYAPSN